MLSTLTIFRSSLSRVKRDLLEELGRMEELRREAIQLDPDSFLGKTHPHSMEIGNLLNPLYLAGIADFENLYRHRYILVRDGFFSLLDFFYRYKYPGKIQTLLLIHEKLQFLIPKPWAENVLTYNIQLKSETGEKKISPKILYLCVSASEGDVRIESFRAGLAKIRDFYGDSINEIEIKLGLFLRDNPYYRFSKEKVHFFAFLLRECDHFLQKRCELLTWHDIEKRTDLFESCYYHMDDECLGHSFSYLDHFFLSHRCTPFDDRFRKRGCGEEVYEISCGYNIHINNFNFKPSYFWDEVNEMARQLGVGDKIIHSDFMLYAYTLADRYMFGNKKESITSSLDCAFNKESSFLSSDDGELTWQ